jgi:hypothetical protein
MRAKEINHMTNNNNTNNATVTQDQYNARLIEVKSEQSETQTMLALLDNMLGELNRGISRTEGVLDESTQWFDGLTKGDETWF